MTRTILVTGAGTGIGRAIAARFVDEGAKVTITGRRADVVHRTADELGARGIVCDATDARQVAALADAFDGTIDVLVNAAGGLGRPDVADGSTRLEALAAEWRADFAANLLSAVLTTAAVQERLATPSAVVSIGSIGAERRVGSYGSAKAALAAWNTGLSAQLGPRGVTCNVISAGYIASTDFFGDAMTDERSAALIAETHDKRAGTPQDIAETARFLASAGARHITGQTIHVNGGAFTTR